MIAASESTFATQEVRTQEMAPALQQILHRLCVIWDAGGHYSEPQHMVRSRLMFCSVPIAPFAVWPSRASLGSQ